MVDPLSVFHAIPYPARVMAASVRSAQLRWWRYGPETDEMVARALDEETASPAERLSRQQQALSEQLHHAATQVPFYRSLWQGGVPGELGRWPILEKETVRARPRELVADDAPRRMFEDHTSGSSGTPTTVWLRRSTVRAWYALAEARWRLWYGVDRHDRWAIIGGQLVAPPDATSPPYWLWNPVLHQLYLSAYHLRVETAADYARALVDHRVVYALGYPSSLYDLARLCLENDVALPQMRVVIANAEPLLAYQRPVIEEAFGCPVRETYGASEAVVAASECEHRSMHLWPEVGVTEVVDEHGAPVGPGEVGDAVTHRSAQPRHAAHPLSDR